MTDGIFSLDEFFAVLSEADIYLIARPGPYINAEMQLAAYRAGSLGSGAQFDPRLKIISMPLRIALQILGESLRMLKS